MEFTLATAEITSHIGDHLMLVGRTPASDRIAFDVLVQQLVRIRLWAVAWKKEKANMGYVFPTPGFDLSRVMDRMLVDDEKYFALALTHGSRGQSHGN